MDNREMPHPSEHAKVRAWRRRYEIALGIAASDPELRAVRLVKAGILIEFMDEVRTADDPNISLTIGEVSEHIEAIEEDIIRAQAQLQREALERELDKD